MAQALAYLHLLSPILLSFPVLNLATPPHEADLELPGIRAITIKTITPRRGFILFFLVCLALTAALDGAVAVVDIATYHNRHRPGSEHDAFTLIGDIVQSVGGLVVYSLTAIFAEWRTRWGDKWVVILAALAFACEIPTLVFTVIWMTDSGRSEKLFAILHIPPSGLRLLLLPILIVVLSNPIIRFQPADERTSLLAESEATAGPSGSSAPDARLAAYGTFDDNGNGTAAGKKPNGSRDPSVEAVTGANTPAQGATTPTGIKKASITIPKKLGEKQDQAQGISWSGFWSRLWKLSPHLWPSTSAKLQLFCVLCVGLLIVGRALNPSVPLMLGMVVRNLTKNQGGQEGPSPWPPFIAYITLRAVQGGGLLSFLQNVLWVPVQQYADREMQLLCFNHLLDLSLAFHTKRNTGEVLKIIDRGSAINNLLQTLLFSAAPTMLDIVIAFGVFFYLYGWSLALLIAVVMISYISFSVVLTNYRTKLRRQMIDRDIKQRGIVSDVLTNWESVKYFTAEQREVSRFNEAILSYQETELKVLISFNLLNLIQSFIITLGLLAGSLIIAMRVLNGQGDAAEFVVFVQYLQQLYAPLDRLGSLYRQLNQNSTDAEKLFALLAQPTEIKDKAGAKELVVTDGIIEFENVHFSYDGKIEALRGVSFRIGKGQSMALVGESGSGKSTILRLLYRFYDINSGHIYIDGQDISEVTQLSLRRAIGIVPQDSVLWNDSIGANVAYGKEGADDDEIIAAAKAARLHDRIMGFPDGYATVVGERGIRLSGGEKQRVSLARMFLKSPTILVLDEATSALDTETEREIQRALTELAKNRSSLSIAHRLSTIINSDQIVVMREGQVVENGTYKELIERDGQFATMWKKQIFSDAELIASAEGGEVSAVSAEEAAAKVIPASTEDEATFQRASPPSTVHELEETPEVGEPSHTEQAEVKAATVEEGYAVASGAAIEPATDTAAAVATETEEAKAAVAETSHEETSAPTAPAEDLTKATPKEMEEETTVAPTTTEAPKVGEEIVQPQGPSYAQKASQPAAPEALVSAVESEPTESTAATEATAPSTTNATPDRPTTTAPTSAATSASKPFPSAAAATTAAAASAAGAVGQRIASSASQKSGLSDKSASAGGDASAQPETPADKGKDKDEKRRKRLSSIKGFVRRISDQGSSGGGGGAPNLPRSNSGLARSGSYSGRPGSAGGENPASPNIGEEGGGGSRASSTPGTPSLETPDDKKKKRFSFQAK